MTLVGVIGLGRMGGAISRNLLRRGYKLVVYDIVKEKIDSLVALGAQGASSPADVASKVDIVLTNVPRAEDVINVYMGPNGIFQGARKGLIAVETSTTDPHTEKMIESEASKRGLYFLVATLGKTVPQAERGETPLFVGGSREAFERPEVQKLFYDMSSGKIFYFGSVEAAVAFKLITNAVGFVNLLSLLEGIIYANKYGISTELFLDAVKETAAYNYWVDMRREKLLKEDYSAYFPIDFVIKDYMYTLKSAEEKNVPLPLTSVAVQYYVMARGRGYGNEDAIALIKLLKELSR